MSDPVVQGASEDVAHPDDARLFGLPGAEHMHFDAAAVYESEIEPFGHAREFPVTIEEWTVVPNLSLVPPADTILERLAEDIGEEMTEDGYDHVAKIVEQPEVVEAAEALRRAISERITYRMAEELVAEHTVTWDEKGEPLLDGEPMYVPAAESKVVDLMAALENPS